ncbi:PQQ-binding-like beta-propeller repeat protein [Thiotrichales bacterium 19X7-9]|nr:PQQ-binding-like beta-propeller repeat protein [Thiotrichales bacterium 19X7-9]
MKNNYKIIKFFLYFPLTSFILITSACHSDIDNNSSSDASDNTPAQLSLISDNEAVLGSQMTINVTLESQPAQNFSLTSTNNETASDIAFTFDNTNYNKDFNITYSDHCSKLTTADVCQITLIPNENSINIINQTLNYTVNATDTDGKIISQSDHLIVEELKLLDENGNDELSIGSGSKKILKLVNDTNTEVDVSNNTFSSDNQQLSFLNSTCNSILSPNEYCTVELTASNNAVSTDANLLVTSKDAVLMGQYAISIKRPEFDITPQTFTLLPYDSQTITIKNNTSATIYNLTIQIPQISGVSVIQNTCNINLSADSSCQIVLNADQSPNSYGSQSITITADNANEQAIQLDAYTPSALNVSLSTDHIIANSNANKNLTVTVTNNQNYTVSDLNLLISGEDNHLAKVLYLSSCDSDTTLAPGKSCQYTLNYDSSDIDYPYQSTDELILSATGSQSVIKSLQINGYNEFYQIPDHLEKTINYLPSPVIKGIDITDNNQIYVATSAGLGISSDNGNSWNIITANSFNHLSTNQFKDVIVSNNTIYLSQQNKGLAISTDQGKTFEIKTTDEGLGSNAVNRIAIGRFADNQNKIYLATNQGLSISKPDGSFINKTTKDNLPSQSIRDVFLDNKGYIYLATSNGIAILDQNDNVIKVVKTTDGLISNNVNRIFVDSNDNIYAGTDSGLSIYNSQTDTWISKTTDDGLSQNAIYAIEVVDGVIYAGTSQYLSISTDGGTTWYKDRGVGYNANAYINDLYIKNNIIYAATNSNLAISNTDNSYRHISSSLPTTTIYDISKDNNILYAASGGSGVYISTDYGHHFTISNHENNQLGADKVYTVFSKNGSIYASTENGLSISNDQGKSWNNKTTANGLSDNKVLQVALDVNNIIYAATANGLSISSDNGEHFTSFTTNDGILSNATNSVSVVNGILYVTTDSGLSVTNDLGETNKKNWLSITTDNGLLSNALFDTLVTDNAIYVASDKGLSKVEVDTTDIQNLQDLVFQTILSGVKVYSLKYTNGILYASTNQGLYISYDNGETFTLKNVINGLTNSQLWQVSVLGSNLYVATNSGIDVTTTEGLDFTSPTDLNNLTIKKIIAIGKTLYVATSQGVAISPDNGINWQFSLSNEYINSIYVNGNSIYAATYANGLYISDDLGQTWSHITTNEGLISNDTKSVVFANNTLYVGTGKGLSILENHSGTWEVKTDYNHLDSEIINGLFYYNNTLYATTNSDGLFISDDNASTWNVKNASNSNLANNITYDVFVNENAVYVATQTGVSILTTNSNYFTNYKQTNGLASNLVYGIYAVGKHIYASTNKGLSYSEDNGIIWNNKTTDQGLSDNLLYNTFVAGSNLYVATNNGISIADDHI